MLNDVSALTNQHVCVCVCVCVCVYSVLNETIAQINDFMTDKRFAEFASAGILFFNLLFIFLIFFSFFFYVIHDHHPFPPQSSFFLYVVD